MRRRFRRLSESVIDVLAGQAIAKSIDTSLTQTQVQRELGKRITELVNSQFPHHQPRRLGRGALIPIGDAPARGRTRGVRDHSAEIDPESAKDLTDKILSKKALESSASTHNYAVEREKEKNADKVEEVLQQTSPAKRAALEKLIPAVGVNDTFGQLAREANLKRMQVSRALREARDILAGKRSRRPGSAPNSNGSPVEGVVYNPPTVSDEARWRLHDGSVISDIGAGNRRTMATNGHKRDCRLADIFSLPRPRWPDYVEHPLFGRGAVLRNRDDNVWVEFDRPGDDGKCRRIMKRYCLKFMNGNPKP